jgi:nucleoside-diphosphate-sugar epimerase
VADKALYQIVGLSQAEKEIFENADFLTHKQVDLSNEASVVKAFEHDGGNYTYVINLAAVTKYSQGKEVYNVNIVQVSKNCAAAAAKYKAARYIEVSTAQVYDAGKKPSKEGDKISPWTDIARAKKEAEDAVMATAGLNYVIVRPAIVYGTGDILGLTPRLITGSIYKETGKKMECLYTKDLQMNTVHVDDVAKALWFLTTNGPSGSVYNLCDSGHTDQGKINKLLEELYGIKTDFLPWVKMQAASVAGTKFLVGYVNDEHLKPFSDACKKYGIHDTPLTPYLDEELIKDNQTSVDGNAITALGFAYDHPKVTVESLKAVLQDFVDKGYFPKEMM